MSKAKHLRRQQAEKRARQESKREAVLAERLRCASICTSYAERAGEHGLLVHPQIAAQLADEILKEPAR